MTENRNLNWVDFYMELADKLLSFKDDRKTLIEKVKAVYEKIGFRLPKLERDNNIVDIDPFTVFGLFNKRCDLMYSIGNHIAKPVNAFAVTRKL